MAALAAGRLSARLAGLSDDLCPAPERTGIRAGTWLYRRYGWREQEMKKRGMGQKEKAEGGRRKGGED